MVRFNTVIYSQINPRKQNGKAFAAVESDRVEVIDVLYKYGINLNQRTPDDSPVLSGATPLHLAAYYDREQSCHKHLLLKANINVVDINGQTALHIAVIQGNINIIKLLIQFGIDTSIVDYNGNLAVNFCRSREDIKRLMINPILGSLADLASGGYDHEEEKEACQLLKMRSGCIGCLTPSEIVNVVDIFHGTPLIWSVANSRLEVRRTLLDMSADKTMKGRSGSDATTLAFYIGNPRIKKIVF